MATYYVTRAAGGSGVGSSGDPFTLVEACDAVGAGDTVYVKADNDYDVEYATGGAKSSIMYLTTDGTNAAPIRWIGYHTTPGDGGVVTLDAKDTLGDCLEGTAHDFYIFENFVFKGGTDNCAETPNGGNMIWKKCSFEGAGNRGIQQPGSGSVFVGCRFRDNTNEGVWTNTTQLTFVFCIFEGNGKEGITCSTSTVFAFCVFYNNGKTSDFKHIDSGSALQVVCINCIFDGENSGKAAYISSAAAGVPVFVNCIFHDHVAGVEMSASNLAAIAGCLFNSNTADTVNVPNAPTTGDGVGDDGCVSDTPGFTNEGNDDYTLASGSAALDAGMDASFTTEFWSDFDLGTNPPTIG